MSAAEKSPYALSRRAVAVSFERASGSYDAAAALQQQVRDELLQRLEFLRLQPARVLDLGCGTGGAAIELAQRYPRTDVLAMDIAPGMLAVAAAHARAALPAASLRRAARPVVRRVANLMSGAARLSLRRWLSLPPALLCGGAERLPLATGSVDVVFSSLMLQWCADLDAVFAEIRRVLRPGGVLLFTSFGPDTLAELRSAWLAVDAYNHVNAFLDMHDVGSALSRQGFAEPVLDVDRMRRDCATVGDLARELKSLGAHNVTSGRARGLTGRQRWQQMQQAYEQQRRDGRLPVTYEVIFGCAWAAQPLHASTTATPGEVRIDAGTLRRRVRGHVR